MLLQCPYCPLELLHPFHLLLQPSHFVPPQLGRHPQLPQTPLEPSRPLFQGCHCLLCALFRLECRQGDALCFTCGGVDCDRQCGDVCVEVVEVGEDVAGATDQLVALVGQFPLDEVFEIAYAG